MHFVQIKVISVEIGTIRKWKNGDTFENFPFEECKLFLMLSSMHSHSIKIYEKMQWSGLERPIETRFEWNLDLGF